MKNLRKKLYGLMDVMCSKTGQLNQEKTKGSFFTMC